jgi:voltage-gated potassium channel Kch
MPPNRPGGGVPVLVERLVVCGSRFVGLAAVLVIVAAVFLAVMAIWLLIVILIDLFRDQELSGWAKAAWVLFLIFLPFLTALVYLIARGGGMRDRAIAQQSEEQAQLEQYVQQLVAATSPADELQKLVELRDKGTITSAKFDAAKAKLLTYMVRPAGARLEMPLGA